jgi:hypothetical protein
MNSPRSKLRGITSASLRYADNEEKIRLSYSSPLQAAGNSNLKGFLTLPIHHFKNLDVTPSFLETKITDHQ